MMQDNSPVLQRHASIIPDISVSAPPPHLQQISPSSSRPSGAVRDDGHDAVSDLSVTENLTRHAKNEEDIKPAESEKTTMSEGRSTVTPTADSHMSPATTDTGVINVTDVNSVSKEQESKSGHERDSSSREGSMERRSLSGSEHHLHLAGDAASGQPGQGMSSKDDLSLASTKGSSDDITAASAVIGRSRTASFSNVSTVSTGSGAVTVKEGLKKSPVLSTSLTAPHRHNSDASSVASSTGKSGRNSDRKRQRWYQSLYPSYKQRSEEFRKLFPTVGESERLLIDYSCALQRDLLVQGRLYVSQYHICFYAKIIAWETNICTPWKSVTALTKERTAKIIPNALSYTTDHEQCYFTSFGQRDKTFTNLYRIWQGAVKEQPMSTQEMWSFIHYQYGDDLGLSSDDEDYIQPAYLCSYPEVMAVVNGADEDEHRSAEDMSGETTAHSTVIPHAPSPSAMPDDATAGNCGNNNETNADVSSSSGSDQGDEALYIPPPPPNGQTFIDHEFRIPFDQLFLAMFSESKLLKDMFVRRKFLETTFGQWTLDPTTDCQVRHVKYCISLGPKTIRTEERQTLLKESVTGRLHLVDSVAQNHGAPYSDSFSVVTHYVLHKISPTVTKVRVATEVVFRKANWAVKAILEKGVMDQLKDYMADLKGRLSTFEAELATQDPEHVETDAASGVSNQQSRRMVSSRHVRHAVSRTVSSEQDGRRAVSFSRLNSEAYDLTENREGHGRGKHSMIRKMVWIIGILLLVNLVLYVRVWDYPSGSDAACADGELRCSDKKTDWANLVRRFSRPENAHLLHSLNDGLASVMHGLRTISTALEELQRNLATKTGEENASTLLE